MFIMIRAARRGKSKCYVAKYTRRGGGKCTKWTKSRDSRYSLYKLGASPAEKAREEAAKAKAKAIAEKAAKKAADEAARLEKLEKIKAEKEKQAKIAAKQARLAKIAEDKARAAKAKKAEEERLAKIAAKKLRLAKIAEENARLARLAEEKEKKRIAEEKEKIKIAEEKEKKKFFGVPAEYMKTVCVGMYQSTGPKTHGWMMQLWKERLACRANPKACKKGKSTLVVTRGNHSSGGGGKKFSGSINLP